MAIRWPNSVVEVAPEPAIDLMGKMKAPKAFKEVVVKESCFLPYCFHHPQHRVTSDEPLVFPPQQSLCRIGPPKVVQHEVLNRIPERSPRPKFWVWVQAGGLLEDSVCEWNGPAPFVLLANQVLFTQLVVNYWRKNRGFRDISEDGHKVLLPATSLRITEVRQNN